MRIRCPNCSEVIENVEHNPSGIVVCTGCLRRVRIPATDTSGDSLNHPKDDDARHLPGRYATAACDPVRYGSAKGVAIALAVALPVSLLMGFLASSIGFYLYVFVLFPIVVGVCVGGAVQAGFFLGKIRSMSIALLLGTICGISAMGAMHHFDNVRWLRENPNGAPGADNSGFFETLTRRADQGFFMVSNRLHLRNNSARISGVVAYFYWLLEGLIATVFACGIPVALAIVPVCRECHTRKIQRLIGFVLVGVDGRSSSADFRCIEAFKLGDLAYFATVPPAQQHTAIFGFAALACPKCSHLSEVEIRLFKTSPAAANRPSQTTIAASSYPHEAEDYLAELCQKFEPAIDQKARLQRN